MRSFRNHMAHYRAEHRTVGCRITHMIGVPAIVASFPMLAFNWRIGCTMFIVGWILQFVGHRYFERNKPVLMADPKNPFTYLAAFMFVGQEWLSMVTRRPLIEEPLSTTTTPEPDAPGPAQAA